MAKKYNLGFFGLSGSGKTCILAALDMQRIVHPTGCTCALLPVEMRQPTGDPESWTAEEKQADILHKSSERLEKAKQQLEQGAVPEGTELSIDFVFDYKLASPQTGEFHLQLIDYGGELVNPQNAPQDIAKELREKLTGMDGLLVLAPAPQPDDTKKGVLEKLHRLQKTIGLIQFSQPIPIVLLITKWDRLAPLSEYTVAQKALTQEELPTDEHQDLYNDLINKVGEDNCKAFPVSAFGECEQHTTEDGKKTEFPKQVNPLESFGLLESFVWLAQRLEAIQSQQGAIQLQTDSLKLQNYEQVVASYKKWRPYPSYTLWKLTRQGKEIASLFPADSDLAKQAIQARRQCSKVWWSRVSVLPPLIVLALSIMISGDQAYKDKNSYDVVHRTLNDPNAKLEDIDRSEQWLEKYYYTAPISHPFSWLFVVSNGQAKSELDESRHRSEQQFWQAIQEAPSVDKKLQAANAYLKALPNGERVGKVNAIVAQSEEALRQRIEQQWWQPVEQAPSLAAKLNAVRAYLKALPNGQHKAEVKNIIAQIEDSLREEKEQRLWQPVEQAMSLNAKYEAARAYLKALPDGKHKAEINNIMVQIEETLRKEEEQRLWQPVLNAKSASFGLQKAVALDYLQEKPDGKHAAEAKQIIAQAEEALHKEEQALREQEQALRNRKENSLWQPVEQAKDDLSVQANLARAYLYAMPNGKHADEARRIIAKYDHESWVKFEKDYGDWFDKGLFLEAARHLSRRQPKDERLKVLKKKFQGNVLNSLATQINQFINQQDWADAYKKLDNYNNWPQEFQNVQKRRNIRDLRRNVQEAEDRSLYTEFLEARDIERAENYLRSAPLKTMLKNVDKYRQYLIDIKSALKLTLILARIEWGDFGDNDNAITVTMDGKKIIEKVGIDAVKHSSTTEGIFGSYQFTKKPNTYVTIKVKIVEHNWLSSHDDNGQGWKKVQVKDLNGFILDLKPPDVTFTNKAVFRLEGMATEPNLPVWHEE